MTLFPLSDAATAADYYEADDYYRSDDGSRSASTWWGRGAQALGLPADVATETFRGALAGRLADGTVLAGGREGIRRPGWDMTFSAPKSVSMQALIAGDTRYVEAHEQAVDAALRYLETRVAAYRETAAGVVTRIKPDGILVARIRHNLSRSVDPQLHTHAVLMNGAHKADGGWRCLDAAELYRQQKLIGAIYRTELARQVIELGCAIRVEHTDGRFELAHISREQIAAFSTRRQEIEAELRQVGIDIVGSTARQREIAALSTRSNKTETDRATVWQEWSQRANEHAVTFKEVPAEHVDGEQRHQTIAEALTFAVDHITERSAIAEHHQILATAIGKAGPYGGEAGISQIETEIAGRVSRGELIAANMRYTTREAIATETETLRIARAGLGTVRPVVSQLWSPDLGDSPLNPEQREARRSILTSTDRVVCIHGWAGTGKTTLMASVREVAEQNGFSISGIAPSAAAARELSKAGIPSETVASFLSRNAVPGVASIVVLDEAGMVGSREMLGVLDAVARGGSRILLIGDQGQLQAVSAGSPYEQLLTDKTQERNPGTAVQRLTQIVRQKCANLRQAVMKSAGRDVRHALKHLSGTTAEIPSASTRWEQIAKQYARLSRTEREQTVVLTGTNFAREAMNNAIRKKLGRDGQGTAVTIVRPRNLTAAEIRSTVSYAPGDIVQPIKTYKLRPLAASPAASEIKVASRSEAIPWTSGSQATVVRVSKGKVELELPGGARVLWQPAVASRVSTYQRAEIIFAAGELVRATANDHRSGVNNGDLFTVSRIEAGAVTLLRAGSASETVTMDRSRALHLEYGYVSTVHAAQGRTVDRVILDASTRSACANERSFYVAISRARHEAWIYTDDRAALPDAMSRPNEKAKALDISSDGKRKEAEFRA